jgi:serine/threonine protein kinase
VTQVDIDQADEALRSEASDPDLDISDEVLSDRLVEAEVISRYQSDKLLTGRTKFNLGPYVVTDFIGAGGMGEVYKAEHNVMGREVAVKVLPANKSTPEAIKSFSREIRTQAKLDHPNLVRAYDAGNDGRVHYLVTEYVPGMDLRRLIRSEGPLNVNQAASVIMFAALGLDYAHQSGLIHRDVKPGNILVTPEGIGKVSDLGLAGFLNDPDDDPRSGKIVGTADYLSPEQIRNPHDICEASDIYSLGCTLYYAITGKVPFPGGTPASKARRHLEETPWHPRRFNPDTNEEFVEIIADMMEKDPALRIQSMTEVVTRLEPWASETAIVPSLHLTKSRWTPPPVPTEIDEQDTHDGEDLRNDNSGGQASQATHSVAGQETRVRPPMPPPLPKQNDQPTNHEAVIGALCIAVPVALAVGVAVGFAIGYVLLR